MKTCIICGKPFPVVRYGARLCCSPECASIRNAQKAKAYRVSHAEHLREVSSQNNYKYKTTRLRYRAEHRTQENAQARLRRAKKKAAQPTYVSLF